MVSPTDRRRRGAPLLWLAATALATAVAWQGVAVVSGQLGADPVAAGAPGALSFGSPRSTNVPGPPAREPVSPAGHPTAGATTAVTPVPQAEAPIAPDTLPAAAAETAPAPVTLSPVPSPPAPPEGTDPRAELTAPTTLVSTTAQAVTPETRIYETGGGSAAVSFTGDRVEVLWATPAPGFATRVDQRAATEVRIEFTGDGGRQARIEAWWDAGPDELVRDDT